MNNLLNTLLEEKEKLDKLYQMEKHLTLFDLFEKSNHKF